MREHAVYRSFLPVAVAGVLGCSEASPPLSACGAAGHLATSTAAITLGSTTSPIGYSERTSNAVALLEVSDGEQAIACSGTLIAPDRVLSAAHCVHGLQQPRLSLTLGPSKTEALQRTSASVVASSAEYDLIVLALERSVPAEIATPLRVALARQVTPALGVLAGYGVTGELNYGTRLFAFADIVSEDATHYRTSAAPASGACIGDSGGPLLWRDDTGSPAVLGVLSNGNASCRGEDDYVRLDAAAQWLAPFLPAHTTDDQPCGALTAEGTCARATLAVWCDGGALSARPCDPGTACGWDYRERGFRCVVPKDDRCAGVTEFGVCRDEVAMRCDGGVLRSTSCCGSPCSRDPLTGQVGCR